MSPRAAWRDSLQPLREPNVLHDERRRPHAGSLRAMRAWHPLDVGRERKRRRRDPARRGLECPGRVHAVPAVPVPPVSGGACAASGAELVVRISRATGSGRRRRTKRASHERRRREPLVEKPDTPGVLVRLLLEKPDTPGVPVRLLVEKPDTPGVPVRLLLEKPDTPGVLVRLLLEKPDTPDVLVRLLLEETRSRLSRAARYP